MVGDKPWWIMYSDLLAYYFHGYSFLELLTLDDKTNHLWEQKLFLSHLDWLNILDHFNYKPVSTWKLKLKHAFLLHQNVLCKHASEQYIYTHMQIRIIMTNLIWKNLKGYDFSRIWFYFKILKINLNLPTFWWYGVV